MRSPESFRAFISAKCREEASIDLRDPPGHILRLWLVRALRLARAAPHSASGSGSRSARMRCRRRSAAERIFRRQGFLRQLDHASFAEVDDKKLSIDSRVVVRPITREPIDPATTPSWEARETQYHRSDSLAPRSPAHQLFATRHVPIDADCWPTRSRALRLAGPFRGRRISCSASTTSWNTTLGHHRKDTRARRLCAAPRRSPGFRPHHDRSDAFARSPGRLAPAATCAPSRAPAPRGFMGADATHAWGIGGAGAKPAGRTSIRPTPCAPGAITSCSPSAATTRTSRPSTA